MSAVRISGILRNRRLWICVAALLLLAVVVPRLAYWYIRHNAQSRIMRAERVHNRTVAIVPGANINSDGEPSMVLRMRIDRAVDLYKAKRVKKLLMSGDNRFVNYNEPDVMKRYAVTCGVPASDVVCDYAGRRTYDTVYRARHIFEVKNGVVVTQDRYMGRSLYLAKSVGLDVVGVAADTQSGLPGMNREYLACVSALLDVMLLHPHPVMGRAEPIDIKPNTR